MFSENLKKYRRQALLTQKELAQKVGVAEITIKQYEQNLRMPRKEILEKLADFFGIESEVLLGEDSKSQYLKVYHFPEEQLIFYDSIENIRKKIDKIENNEKRLIEAQQLNLYLENISKELEC